VTTEYSEHLRRFLSALDELSRGTPLRRLKNANDVARDVALLQEQLDQILAEALAAGLLERHPDNLDLVRLTDTGVAVARGKAQR
jgi:DNA-binding MarR family transcriptional regulator